MHNTGTLPKQEANQRPRLQLTCHGQCTFIPQNITMVVCFKSARIDLLLPFVLKVEGRSRIM